MDSGHLGRVDMTQIWLMKRYEQPSIAGCVKLITHTSVRPMVRHSFDVIRILIWGSFLTDITIVSLEVILIRSSTTLS